MSTLTFNQNGHKAALTNWRTLSVRDFFGQLPWTGESRQEPWTPPSMTGESASPTPDMRLSVNEFFNRFPWDGKPNIAAPMTPLEVQPDMPASDNDLTLDGFADLF